MAYVSISMTEIMNFVDKNINYNRERIKSIKLINGNQVEITVSIGRFFPDVKVVAAYNSYKEDRLYFTIISKGGVKILMGLANEMGGKSLNDYIVLENSSVRVDINKLLSDNLKGVNIKDVTMSGEQMYITINLK